MINVNSGFPIYHNLTKYNQTWSAAKLHSLLKDYDRENFHGNKVTATGKSTSL